MSPWFFEGFLCIEGVLIVKRKHRRNYEFVWRNFTRPRQQIRDPKKEEPKEKTQEDPNLSRTESNGDANNDPIWCIKIYVYTLAFPILICIKLTREGSRRQRNENRCA